MSSAGFDLSTVGTVGAKLAVLVGLTPPRTLGMLGVHAAAVTLALLPAAVVTAEQPQVLEKKTEQVLFAQQKPAPGATAAAAAGSEAQSDRHDAGLQPSVPA